MILLCDFAIVLTVGYFFLIYFRFYSICVFEYHWHCKAPTNFLSGEGGAVIKKIFCSSSDQKNIDNAATFLCSYMALPNLTKIFRDHSR